MSDFDVRALRRATPRQHASAARVALSLLAGQIEKGYCGNPTLASLKNCLRLVEKALAEQKVRAAAWEICERNSRVDEEETAQSKDKEFRAALTRELNDEELEQEDDEDGTELGKDNEQGQSVQV